MISCREKLVTNERTNDSESIGPTSEVGGSNNRKGGGLKKQQVVLKEKVSNNRRHKDGGKHTTYLLVSMANLMSTANNMKYVKATPDKTVPTTGLSLEGIKQACAEVFNQNSSECTLLPGLSGGGLWFIYCC